MSPTKEHVLHHLPSNGFGVITKFFFWLNVPSKFYYFVSNLFTGLCHTLNNSFSSREHLFVLLALPWLWMWNHFFCSLLLSLIPFTIHKYFICNQASKDFIIFCFIYLNWFFFLLLYVSINTRSIPLKFISI